MAVANLQDIILDQMKLKISFCVSLERDYWHYQVALALGGNQTNWVGRQQDDAVDGPIQTEERHVFKPVVASLHEELVMQNEMEVIFL